MNKKLLTVITLVLAMVLSVATPVTAEAASKYYIVPVVENNTNALESYGKLIAKSGKKMTFTVYKKKSGKTVKTIPVKDYKKEKITFKSKNTKVATVNSKGVVTTKGYGKTDIVVNSKYTKATIRIEVSKIFDKLVTILETEVGPNVTELNDFDKVYAALYWVNENIEYSKKNRTHNAETILKRKYGACNEYTILFRHVATALGIESKHLSSTKLNHAWANVKLDGEWYGVDPTSGGFRGFNKDKVHPAVAKWNAFFDAYNEALDNGASDEELDKLEYDAENHPDSYRSYTKGFCERVGNPDLYHQIWD